MRLLLTVLSIIFIISSGYYFFSQGILYDIAQAAGFGPTPTPEHKIVARIQNMLIDETALVLRSWQDEDVTVLQAETGTLYVGGRISGSGIQEVLLLIDLLREGDLAVREANIYNETYTQVLLSDGVHVLYSSNRDPQKTAYELQEMYAILRIEGVLPERIDMRFEKPAIIQ